MSKGFGGLELYVLKVAKFLKENNYNYNLVIRNDSFMYQKLLEEKISSTTFSSVFYHLPLISAFKLAKYINSNKIDVLHIHWGKDLLLAVLAKIFSRRKVKLIYTRHMALTRKKDDIYHRFLYRNVDAYLVITKVLYNEAVEYLPIEKSKIHIIYHGVPEKKSKPDDCKSFLKKSGMHEHIFRLVIFGRIEEGKGQHTVIDAVNELKSKGKKVELAVIGHIMDEEYYSSIQNDIKEYDLEDSIFYLGFHDNPINIMPCFDTVVLATKCETFGLVLPEAMRAGVVVIGSNCGGVPEIIEHEKTGLLFESENAIDLADKLEHVFDDIAFRNKLAIAGKNGADKRFSEEKHFETLINIFESS